MIPKIIHYCWIGGAPLSPLAEQCIASWKRHMPSWQFMRWDEATLSQALMKEPTPNPCPKGKGEEDARNRIAGSGEGCWLDYLPLYVKQAYEARKFAFVSDYVRLWALEQYGGLYMDVDFEVFRPFDDLMDKYPAFAGYEGSKRQPVMQGVIASEPHGAWVRDMLATYEDRTFIKADGSLDLTPNTSYFTDRLEAQGFVADGVEKDFFLNDASMMPNEPLRSMLREHSSLNDEAKEESSLNTKHSPLNIYFLHVFPVHYFCPVLTTGEDVRTEETYCEHKGESSWAKQTWKGRLLKCISPRMRTELIKLKRKVMG